MGTTLIDAEAANDGLTAQQRHFVEQLLADDLFSPTAAARAAGYRHPSQAANKLLKNAQVASVLAAAQRERSERLEVRADEVLSEVALCALRDPADLCDENGMIDVSDLRNLPPSIRRCIDGVKCRQQLDADGNVVGQSVELKFVPKLPALELMMKHLGLLDIANRPPPPEVENPYLNAPTDLLLKAKVALDAASRPVERVPSP